MSWVAAGIGAASAVTKIVVGGVQTHRANKALKALGAQKYPEFTDSPEMMNAYNRAEAMSKYGYSPEEKAQFEQGLARNQQGAYQQAVDMSGGNLSSAIGGVLQANNTDAINKFAAGNAGLKRSNIQYADTLAEKLQHQRNLQTHSAIARRQMLEQAYGAAKSSGIGNMVSGVSGAGALASTAIGGGARTSGGATVDQNSVDIDNELAASNVANNLSQQKIGMPPEGNSLTYEEQMQDQQRMIDQGFVH